jgi:DNA-binding NarL/FixJ family response regulator
MSSVAVAVLATDPISEESASALISSHPQLRLVAADHADPADVLLFLADVVGEDVLASMEHASRRADPAGTLPIVLVAGSLEERHLLRAIDIGLVGLLVRQESGFAQVADAIMAVDAGRARLPEVVVRSLLHQVRSIGRELVARHGTTLVGLTTREVDVLRLLSEGLDNGEVARKLNYSERTVKNIIRNALNRYQLRNRTQAVAYALRRGVL